jgi:hypothetical protein
MKRFCLLIGMAGFLILNGFAAAQAQSPQPPPAAGKTYVMPAEIKIFGEAAALVTDANEAKALADEAKKNACVKEIKPKDGNITLYLIFCGTAQEPYCTPQPPGQPRKCY